MRLKKGETIFDKMGISYDELRTMENPVVPVSHYYKSRLRPGESLWWVGDVEESSAPATIRLWSALSAAQKEECIIQGLVLFPELTKASGATKYNRYSLWLASQKEVVNPNARDGISAGGQVLMKTAAGFEVKMPAVFGKIQKYRHELEEVLLQMSESTLKDCWKEEVIFENRIEQWCALVAAEAGTKFDANLVMQVLKQIFQF